MHTIGQWENRAFELEEGSADPYEDRTMCPMCGCCDFVQAEIIESNNIFEQARSIQEQKPPILTWICRGGCTRDRKHLQKLHRWVRTILGSNTPLSRAQDVSRALESVCHA
jgi:hypothetical protein